MATTDPPLPVANQPVVVTFHAAGTELDGYTGDVYAHTGVGIEGVGDWQNVIGDWNNNSNQPRMTRIEANLYELEITPSIQAFYSVPASRTIVNMSFVFRSSDSSRQSRPDIFIDVAPPGLTLSILSPAGMQPIVAPGETFNIEVAANESDSIALYVNQQWLASTTDDALSYAWTASDRGRFDIDAYAWSNGDMVEESTYFFVRPEVVVAELPEDVINGINYIDDTTVTLVLHDPPAKKEHVFVIADFNDWGVGDDNFMHRTPDGKHFWITITGLTPGQEYAFQYLVDGDLRLADPYTEKVLEPFLDHQIRNEGRYPGLIAYPTGKTEHQVSVLQTAREPYDWQHTDFVPPPIEDLVIYELLIRDFLGGNNNTYAGLRDTLHYLKRLGVNAIELMPVTNFEGNLSWGYNPSFFFAADKYYGPRRELKKLIDEAHGLGMAVIIDMVWNHSFRQSPLLRMYYDEVADRPSDDNPWYSDPIFHNPNMNFGYKFDHGSPYFVEFMDRTNRYWLEEFRVDGFRFDLTKGFTTRFKGPNDEWGSLLDMERVNNLRRLYDQLKAVNPDTYVILEHLAGNQEETMLANYGMLLWGNLSHSYQEASMGHLSGSNFDWISYQRRGWNDPHLIGYMESHDEERMMYKNVTWGNSTNALHNVKDTTIALLRSGQAASFFFTIPGPKMLWQFGELGYDYSIDFNGRTGNKPVRWDYYQDWRRKYLHDVYTALIHLKINNEVFRTTDYNLSLGGAMKRIHLNHETNQVTVLGNFGVTEGSMNPHFQQTGTWYEFFTGDTLQVTNVNQVITMPPGEYRLYSTVAFDQPGPPTSLRPEAAQVSAAHSVYPNPSPSGFTFSWDGHTASSTTLEIINMQGQSVYLKQLQGQQDQNSYFWNGQSANGTMAPPGIYLYRIQNAEQVFSGKLVVQ